MKKVTQIILALSLSAAASAQEEGGYIYNHGEDRFVDNVWNFLSHFTYEQYYWCEASQFTTNNNNRVDSMDFAYYSGHGSNFYLGMGPGAATSGVNIGSTTQWGDTDLEFIVFQSCQVVPSPIDRADWYQTWVGPTDVFQGLHHATGYRTNSYSGNGISDNYGERVRDNQRVRQAWFAAVDDERSIWAGDDYPGYASGVYHSTCSNDRYYDFVADPPAGHTSLTITYQY